MSDQRDSAPEPSESSPFPESPEPFPVPEHFLTPEPLRVPETLHTAGTLRALNGSYIRLLRLYPRDHRQAHGQEMLDMLIAGTAPGRRRPHPRDVIDLVHGATLIRLRRTGAAFSESGWREAVGVTGVAGAMAQAAFALTASAHVALRLTSVEPLATITVPTALRLLVVIPLIALMAAISALSGRRTSAVLCAGAYVIAVRHFDPLVALAGGGAPSGLAHEGVKAVAAPLIALALSVPPGPARGAELLRRRAVRPWLVAILLAMIAYWWTTAGHPYASGPATALLLILLAAAAGKAVHSHIGRRAAALLAVPIAGLLKFMAAADGEGQDLSREIVRYSALPAIAFMLVATLTRRAKAPAR